MNSEATTPVAPTKEEAIKKVNDLRRRILATRDHLATGTTPPPEDHYTEEELRDALLALRANRGELVSESKTKKKAAPVLTDEDLAASLGL